MPQHTDRAVADAIDALREFTPEVLAHISRYSIAQGIAGLACVAVGVAMIVYIGAGLEKAKATDKKEEAIKAVLFLGYCLASLLAFIALGNLAYNSLTQLIAPEGAAIMKALELLGK